MNVITLVGRVGNDPEFGETSTTRVCNFSLATKRGKDITDWHKIAVFGKSVDTVEKYVRKGDQLSVSGQLIYSKWEKDGVRMTTAEVRVFNLELLGKRSESTSPPQPPKVTNVEELDDDLEPLPF